MSKIETTRRELNLHGITRITDGSVLLLSTVTLTDNRQDTWLECIDDNGDRVRLIPDTTGHRNKYLREVMVMNCQTGQNRRLVCTLLGGGFSLRSETFGDKYAIEKVAAKIPYPCLEWAVERSR